MKLFKKFEAFCNTPYFLAFIVIAFLAIEWLALWVTS